MTIWPVLKLDHIRFCNKNLLLKLDFREESNNAVLLLLKEKEGALTADTKGGCGLVNIPDLTTWFPIKEEI